MRRDRVFLVLLICLPFVASAQEAPSPRQAYQRAEALFAQGHPFTAEEETQLTALRAELVDSGDTDLAASLDLVRLGAASSALALKARAQARKSLGADTQAWIDREKFLRDRDSWRTTRDAGLVLFSASVAASLLLTAVVDRNEGLLRSGFYLDWQDKMAFDNGLKWAVAGSMATAFFSLFPLLWGEARQ